MKAFKILMLMNVSIAIAVPVVLASLTLQACAKRVHRPADVYTVETLASLERQLEAADALLQAAEAARAAGDRDACVSYAKPALLIEATAIPQAQRSLFLAGLRYPEPTEVDGEIRLIFPQDSDQPDPGPSRPVRDPSEVCGE